MSGERVIVAASGARLIDEQGRRMLHDPTAPPCCEQGPGDTWCPLCGDNPDYSPNSIMATFSGITVCPGLFGCYHHLYGENSYQFVQDATVNRSIAMLYRGITGMPGERVCSWDGMSPVLGHYYEWCNNDSCSGMPDLVCDVFTGATFSLQEITHFAVLCQYYFLIHVPDVVPDCSQLGPGWYGFDGHDLFAGASPHAGPHCMSFDPLANLYTYCHPNQDEGYGGVVSFVSA